MLVKNSKEKESKNTNGKSAKEDPISNEEIPELECPASGHIGIRSNEQESTPDYIGIMKESMEEWYSKPREGYHVSDVTLCPRMKVFQRIDRRPIGAKTVSIYSAGKAIHEAIQWLFLSNKRTFEREKYVEFEDMSSGPNTGLGRHFR